MYFEQTCVVYLIVRPSVGRGLKLEDVSRGKKMYFVANSCCLLNCKVFGGSRVKTRRCISRREDVFLANLCFLLSCKAFGGSKVKSRRCISKQ